MRNEVRSFLVPRLLVSCGFILPRAPTSVIVTTLWTVIITNLHYSWALCSTTLKHILLISLEYYYPVSCYICHYANAFRPLR